MFGFLVFRYVGLFAVVVVIGIGGILGGWDFSSGCLGGEKFIYIYIFQGDGSQEG